jgi:hypothetical protein
VRRIKIFFWYALHTKWWRKLVPYLVINFVTEHFNVCRASAVMWRDLGSDIDTFAPTPTCGQYAETQFHDYCGQFGLEVLDAETPEFKAACKAPCWMLRKLIKAEEPQ